MMLNSDHNLETNIDEHQLAVQQFLDGTGSLKFITGDIPQSLDSNSPYSLDSASPGNLEQLKGLDVMPTDLHSIDSSDLLALDQHLVAPTSLSAADIYSKSIQVSNTFPNLEEHNNAGMDFELNLNNANCLKNSWYYSPVLQKVFIKLEKSFYIEAVYIPKDINEPLQLRVMMVYVNDIISPVQRCQNHLFIDTSTEINVKHSVLRSENANVQYTGFPGGKSMHERLCVLIPLGIEKPNDLNQIKQCIALKFVCQNSCIRREPTALIFTLENLNGVILGKRIVHVKVCSCPKRDKANDEKKLNGAAKREGIDLDHHPGKRPSKLLKIKEEPDSISPLPSPTSPDLTSNGIRISVELPNIGLASEVVKSAFNIVAGAMALDPRQSEKYSKSLRDLKKMLERFGNQPAP